MILSTLEYTLKPATISATAIYYKSDIDALSEDRDWEFSDFRPPKSGEMYWSSKQNWRARDDFPETQPRFIIKKKKQKIDPSKYICNASEIYGKEPIEVPEGYEFTGEFRLPAQGEWFLHNEYVVSRATLDFSSNPKLILRRSAR